jgi:hypothetical protein
MRLFRRPLVTVTAPGTRDCPDCGGSGTNRATAHEDVEAMW